ncbi:hypothetical protein GIB67_007972 [Kingdonia uniflora]|uniref:C2 NT-type domain-containing protein n=1 Tax=Kingdonia uniflora TaxID=39325 RepID=A0A7J7PCJ9_9MAGN|nr:hypothetical protein GIB67_005988 [Kingdonia uniflora]KAF6176874.1 hypothetical protein GIB67_007972 [Kingdonia uniflora]
MLAKVESGKRKGGDGKLLEEIEALGQALYLNKNPQRGFVSGSDIRSKSVEKPRLGDPKLKPRLVKEETVTSSHQKDKKSSIWNWKPLKALSHIRNRRFNCSFSLHVHSIEGLPSSFNDFKVCVHWKRRDGELKTHSIRVFEGAVEFEETLTHRCSVYGSRNGPHHSAKYEAKHFLLFAAVVGVGDLDLGKHRVDLTRLLPLTLEELEEEKSSGKWTTSFKLSGKAKGATLNVSFGYMVIGDESANSHSKKNTPEPLNFKQARLNTLKGEDKNILRRSGSLPGVPNQRSHQASRSVEDGKILHEVLPSSRSELASSVSLLYEKLDEGKMDTLTCSKPEFEVFSEQVDDLKSNICTLSSAEKENVNIECEDAEFSVVEQGIEILTKELVKSEEDTVDIPNPARLGATELDDIAKGCDGIAPQDESSLEENHSKDNSLFTEESVMNDLDSVIQSLSTFEPMEFDSPQSKFGQANHMGVKSNYKGKVGRSLSVDDSSDSVANEFLSMLGIDHSPFGLSSDSDPESPRERLLRKFEKESLAGGNNIFDFDTAYVDEVLEIGYDAPSGSGWGEFPKDFELPPVESETSHVNKSKTRAKMLEDLETEALMREWGLNEKAFQNSPPNSASGFGSPINFPPEEQLELPALGDGLGPFIQTTDGGFLRSMSPSLFKDAKNSGNLIMQVSSPVVVPAEMGSGIMEILQGLASMGIEKLSMQAKKLMPLEDITGKTMQQVAWEAVPTLGAPERQDLMHQESEVGQFKGRRKGKAGSSGHKSTNLDLSSVSKQSDSEYVSLEDLAPLAMDKIEALSIEGLRIQSGMSDEEAPSNISPQAIGEISALEGRRDHINGSLGLEGAGGLQLLDIKDGGDDVDGLMGLSITLDEWMRLDAGIVDEEEENQISERTSKILAAHHATRTDLVPGLSKGDKKRGKGKRCGLLGNNFTVALMVQLRDPLRNYEPVGTPMLALIQVERVFLPPKPKIYNTVSERTSKIEEEDDDDLQLQKKVAVADETKEQKKEEEEKVPQFKITEVHVAGLKPEPGKKKLWGSASQQQQQSGSRWLLASGMGKSNKHPFMKSKAVSKPTKPVSSSSSSQVTNTTVQPAPGDTLWSTSSRIHGTGERWKELAALNPHIRNPNVIFPNEKIRLR